MNPQIERSSKPENRYTTDKNKLVRISGLTFIFAFMAIVNSSNAQSYQPSPENLKNREWFQNAKFGLFIHWGVYSVLGDGEWVMNQQQIPIKAYEKIPSFFNPTDFDPAAWVRMAKEAGMKYITITSKHHDGFAMWDSKVSDYNIVKRTPYGKDVLKMLAEGRGDIAAARLSW